jgi:hypothetical protein
LSASAVRGVSRAERGDRAASPRPSRSAPRSWRSTGHASKVLRRFTASPSRRDPQEWIPRTVQMMQSEAPMRRSAATQHVADKDQPREPWSWAVGVEARACFACQVAAERGRTVAGSCMAGKRSEGSASASCQQSASKSPSHRTTWHRVASAALPPELRRCSTANSAGQRRVGPHSLHTAEATGSIPVTPTSQNASPPRSSGPFARRFARRSPPGGGRPWSAWLDPSRWRAGQQLGRGAAEPRRWRTCPIWLWEQGVASSRLRSGLLLG